MKKETKDSSARKGTGCCSSIEACGTATLSHVRRILVPVDFSEDSESALRCATHLAKQCGASINAVYGAESMDDLKKEVTDLIVISAREQSAIEQMMRHAPCPVLVVHKNGTSLCSRGND
jgi:nucleotide-binding universal stress UspA family protein